MGHLQEQGVALDLLRVGTRLEEAGGLGSYQCRNTLSLMVFSRGVVVDSRKVEIFCREHLVVDDELVFGEV